MPVAGLISVAARSARRQLEVRPVIALAGAVAVIVTLAMFSRAPHAQDATSTGDLSERAFAAMQSGDLATAAQMFQELGDQGVPQGYTMLGQIKRDLGDNSDAARWFERGAEDGDLLAMLEGGEILSDPKFGIVDARRAFKLWQSAAERGAARGQYEAGRSLMIGQGVRKDDLSGADWLEKSARQCFAPAQLAYALALREGRGRQANGEEAFSWIIAAERSSDDWQSEDLERLSTLEREISAYMSTEQVERSYCNGLELLASGCGNASILFQIERWLVCADDRQAGARP
ncbi:MAG: sel1 repeat family protein [Rhizobiales bacterium]|nr:sel1 repeat family protein [Hyphomicrobiales bacterium]